MPASPDPTAADGHGDQGASPNERLLFSAQQDLEDMFTELEAEGGYDINFKDGLGNTALHYAVMHLSPRVLELILEHEGADVDLLNHQGLAPLHCAMQIAQPLPRVEIAKLLLEAGADPRTKNSRSQKPIDMLPPPSPSDVSEDVDLRERLKEAEAELIDAEDVAIDEYKYDADDVASDESG